MVFEHPTIHELAATVDDAGAIRCDVPSDVHHEPMAASGLSADELAAVNSMFAASRTVSRDRDEAKVAVEDVMALSPLQQGLFSLSRLSRRGCDGAADPYVIAMSADVVGVFDAGPVARLRRSAARRAIPTCGPASSTAT